MIDEELFRILVCPACKGELEYNKDKSRLLCRKCGKVYDIKEGIPVLLPK
ncbi:Trm112 family protein [Candidatus Woesearchaeota archaeon]|nr:Trm112 family protein [Candidatus Woesearchaeota archaeon]